MRAQFWAPPPTVGPGQQTRLSPPIGVRGLNVTCVRASSLADRPSAPLGKCLKMMQKRSSLFTLDSIQANCPYHFKEKPLLSR